ncbi:MAG: 4Fe-4S binding protein, partial [Defluviitaleaceae bacterium]|nr:4Fe-4S binding protein [Defluviitaleaceae bacterium]
LQKMTLGEPDASGRRSPIPIEGGEEWLEATTIIAAIGQDVSIEGLNPLENFHIDENFRTEIPNVYAIGDATGKSRYAIEAIGHGRKVAEKVDAELAAKLCTKTSNISEQLPEVLVCAKKTAEDFAEEVKKPRNNGAEHVIRQGERPDFSAVQAGLTPAEATSEADRCLSCGCADYYECKLLKLANIYGADTNKFPEDFHKKPKHKIDRTNFNFHRDMNKCVLCGLCVQACEKNEAISAINRGFNTEISAAFGKPLQNRDECSLCGNCVARCPVGALTEASPLPKHLVTTEEITETTCMQCGNICSIKLTAKAGQILRCLPPEGKALCEVGRFGFLRMGEKLFTPLVKKDGLLRRANLPEAAKAVCEGINVLKAQYGAESIGIAVSPRYTLEDISAIKGFADHLKTPHIFTFTDTSDEEKTYCNTTALKDHNICTNSDKFIEKIQNGEIKGLIVFGDDMPNSIADNPPEFIVLQAAYTSALTTKPARLADVVLPAPGFGEISGHVIDAKTGLRKPVNPAIPPACGFQTRDLFPIYFL